MVEEFKRLPISAARLYTSTGEGYSQDLKPDADFSHKVETWKAATPDFYAPLEIVVPKCLQEVHMVIGERGF